MGVRRELRVRECDIHVAVVTVNTWVKLAGRIMTIGGRHDTLRLSRTDVNGDRKAICIVVVNTLRKYRSIATHDQPGSPLTAA